MHHIKHYLAILLIVIVVSGQNEEEVKEVPSETQIPADRFVYEEGDSSETQIPADRFVYEEGDSSETQVPADRFVYEEGDSSETQVPADRFIYEEGDSLETQLSADRFVYEEGGGFSQNPPTSNAKDSGEPKVTYYTPVGYAPATAGPLTIKKVAHPVETGKGSANRIRVDAVSYTHLRAHETVLDLVCRLLLENKKHDQHIPRTSA